MNKLVHNLYTIQLTESFDRIAVTEIYPQLLQAVLDQQRIQFDGSKVQRVTIAGVQLLISWVNTMEQTDGQMAWSAVSPYLRRQLVSYGLEDRLMLPK